MPTFGARSRRHLETLHPSLRSVLEAVIQDVDFTILCGRRGKAEQEEHRATGRSQVGWPYSKHNCPDPIDELEPEEWPEDPEGLSQAVDVAPYPIDWEDYLQFAYLAGRIVQEAKSRGIIIRWGGDWDQDGQGNWRDPDNSFNDLPHFELVL